MSVPDTNALPPAPLRMKTRTCGSASTFSHALTSASYIAHVIALRACGRLKVRKANGGSIWNRVSDTFPPRARRRFNHEGREGHEGFYGLRVLRDLRGSIDRNGSNQWSARGAACHRSHAGDGGTVLHHAARR